MYCPKAHVLSGDRLASVLMVLQLVIRMTIETVQSS